LVVAAVSETAFAAKTADTLAEASAKVFEAAKTALAAADTEAAATAAADA